MYVLGIDCAENDLSDWIEIPASSEVIDANELGTDDASHVVSAKCTVDDVKEHVVTWRKSHKMKANRRMTYPARTAHSAVSRTDSLLMCF